MKKIFLLSLVGIAVFTACSKSDTSMTVENEIVKEWRKTMWATNVVPAPMGRSDSGSLVLQVRDDRSIIYQYHITKIDAGDVVQRGGIYAGDSLSNGTLMLDFNARTELEYSSGVLPNIRQSLIDSLMDDNIEKYVQVTSSLLPDGMVRAQLQ